MITHLTLTREALVTAGRLGGDLAMASIISYLQQWPEGVWSVNVVENVAAFWCEPEEGIAMQLNKLIAAGAVDMRTDPDTGKTEYRLS